jgi:DnaA family protein
MKRQLTLNVGLSDHACFGNFFSGANAATLHAIRELTGSEQPGLLVLCGVPGCGKTHLLYAAQKASIASGRPASYLSMADPAVVASLDGFDDLGSLVCLDDIDRAAGGKDAERLLFNLVEHVRQTRGGMLVGSRRPPLECGFRAADLVSRLNSGVVLRLEPLSDEGRAAALRLRARQRGFDLPEEVISYVLKRFPRDASALFGLLDRIDSCSLSEQRKVTIPFVKKLEKRRDWE